MIIQNNLFDIIILTNDEFSNIIFNSKDINNIMFSNVNTDKILFDIRDKKFKNCLFVNCKFDNIRFINNIFVNCLFDHCKFNNCDFIGPYSYISDVIFSYSDFINTNFNKSKTWLNSILDACDLTNCKLHESFDFTVDQNKVFKNITKGYYIPDYNSNIIIEIDISKDANVVIVYGKFDYCRTDRCTISKIYTFSGLYPFYNKDKNKIEYQELILNLDKFCSNPTEMFKEYRVGDEIIIDNFDTNILNVFHSRNKKNSGNIGIGFFRSKQGCLEEINSLRGRNNG